MRFFFHIGYHGYYYRGWQYQPKGVHIQEIIEDALSKNLKEPITVMGCGRTDAMVHASQFFFHADIVKEWDYDLMFRLNKTLPKDIAIFEIIPMQDHQHARFDATARTYDYFLHSYKDPFLSQHSALYLQYKLNLDEIKKAVALLTKYNDYRAFCRTPNDYKTTICNVTSASLYTNSQGDRVRFQISANRFLGRMIRILMGKMIEIGHGQVSVDEFESYLISKQTPKLIEPAHPQGLYLSKVTYPYLDIPPRTNFARILNDKTDEWKLV